MDLEMWPQRLGCKLVFGSELSRSHLGFCGAQEEVIPLLLPTADPGSAVRAETLGRSILAGIGSAERGVFAEWKLKEETNEES